MNDLLLQLGRRLDESTGVLSTLDAYWLGTQPASYLSPESQDALGDRLRALCVNFPRLAVTSLAERLRVTGFRTAGPDEEPDTHLWKVWRANRLDDAQDAAHVDALVYGRSFVIVWAGPNRPRITVESARQVAVDFDPASREVTAATKRWVAGGKGHAVLYLADRILRFVSDATVDDPAALPPTGWTQTQTVDNPLGMVPVVPIVNRGRLLDLHGVSEMQPLLDLTDAVSKLHADAMVTSEFYARPRRWVSGLEIVEDDQGNPVKPFSAALDDVWQAEAPDTKFGQFDAARLDGSKMRVFGQAWADVARLAVAVRDGVDPRSLDVETVWANPETRTPAQAADAAAKLAGIGVPLPVVLAEQMGYSPAQIQRVREAARGSALDAAGVNLDALIPWSEAS